MPKLTTIQQPGTRIAERCVKILLQCIENNGPSVREQVDFTLVAGESTRKMK